MRAASSFIGAVAALALASGALGCEPESRRQIIDRFIDDTPAVDLTDREAVERAVFHSQPEWIILESWVGLAYVRDLDDGSACPAVVDRSDPAAGTVAIEYRGDGCVRGVDGNVVQIDGRISLDGDHRTVHVTYDGVVLTVTNPDHECMGLPFSERLEAAGELRAPTDNGGMPTSILAGEYDILVKYEISRYTEECRLERLVVAHDHEIQVEITDSGMERTIFEQRGRSAVVNHGFAVPELDQALPEGSFSADIAGLAFEPYVCSEPTGGRITLRAGGHTVVVEPNGGVDCDRDHCAPWLLDGDVQPGLVCGLQGLGCQVSTRPRAPAGIFVLFGLAALLLALAALARRSHRDADGVG